MDVSISTQEGRAILRVAGRMDATTAPQFERECAALIESGERHLVAELSGLEYISSAGLRIFLATAKKLKPLEGEIRICGMSGLVREVFSLSGFISLFAIYPSLDEALAARP
ncbi:MAG TPA: STAS domain-containing protein [Spirochaetota bacterium]|nr:STAS domain-containing protein [Spirochaetota bacterium]HNT12389.1 STAS domain-containing protein [Spirochaetota bacterium]